MKTRLLILFLVALPLSISLAAKTKRTLHGVWELVWKEDFRGRSLSDTWRRIPRYPNPSEWNKFMSTDDRLFRVRRGKLTLFGLVNDFLPNDTAHYLTGGIFTKDRLTFQRGRIEIRLKMDNASGAWPAAWLLPQGGRWPDDGEIDIMERLNSDDFAYQTVHSSLTERAKDEKPEVRERLPKSGFQGPIKNGKYNVYGVELYADSLCFFINDTYIGTYKREPELGPEQYPFDRPMYMLIDMQLGAYWIGAVKPEELPYRYQIDYVKYYKKKD